MGRGGGEAEYHLDMEPQHPLQPWMLSTNLWMTRKYNSAAAVHQQETSGGVF